MSDKKKLIIAIVAVLLIIAVVGGGTFAYWSWQTSTAQRTNVSFEILDASESGDMSASIAGNGTATVTSLIPTNNCAGTNALVKEVVISYKNNTDNGAKITANLNLTNLTAGATAIDYTKLSYLKWAITTTPDSCTGGQSGDFGQLSLSANTEFPVSVTTIENTVGTTTDLEEEIELETYYLYVWLDYNYNHTNYGSTNNDPMQNLSFTLEWSGTMEQIG
ncbi:MAG: hypothetical protein IJZ79_07255 [Bacilli bacterium]|nr:hypothetical protein [Bacilli bacterium]